MPRSPVRRAHLQVVPKPHALISSLFPPLNKDEISTAAERVKLYGQREAIEILDGQVVAGWQEYLACVEAKVAPTFTEIEEPEELVEYVVRRNVPRTLSYLDRAVIAVLAQVEWKKLGLARMREGGRTGGKGRDEMSRPFGDGERWWQAAAKIVGVRPNLVRQLAQIHAKCPDVFDAVRARRIKIIRVARDLPARLPDPKDRKAVLDRYEAELSAPLINVMHNYMREKLLADVPVGLPKGERYALHVGRMEEKSKKIPDGSVQLVHVDIEYGDVAMAEETARIAARILISGGVYALLAGNEEAPAIIRAVARYLDFVTIGSLTLVGSSGGGALRAGFGRGRRGAWVDRVDSVPVYFFSKGALARAINHISFHAPQFEKQWHKWQKPLPPTLDLVASCVDAGSLVVDPCCGSGTTGEAALRHGCSFIGIDVDKEAVKVASARLSEVERELRQVDGPRPRLVKAGRKGTKRAR